MPDLYGNGYPNAPERKENFSDDLSVRPINLDQTPKPKGDPILNSIFSDYNSVLNSEKKRGADIALPAIRTMYDDTARYLDPNLGFDALDPNLEVKYGEQQGIIERLKNRLLKTGATALTSFAGAFVTDVNKILGFETVNDPALTAMNDWLENMDRNLLPNYQNQYQKDNPLLSLFNPFKFTSFIDSMGEVGQNFGYTVGAIGQALVLDTLVGAATAGIGEAVLLPRQLERIASGLGKFSRVIANGGKEYEAFKATILQSDDLYKGINKAYDTYSTYKKWADSGRFLLSTSISAYNEAIVEANNNYRELKKELEKGLTNSEGRFVGTKEDLERIEKTSLQSGQSTILPNFVFLAASNALGLQSILRPSKAAIQATQKALGKNVSINVVDANTVKAVTPELKGLKGLGNRLTSPTSIIKDNIREAFEEGFQFAVSDANKEYYKKQFEANGNNIANSLAEEYYSSMGKMFSTEEGLKSMALGFLGGAVQGGVRRIANRSRGVLYGAALANQIQNNLNQYSTTAIFNGNRNELVRSASILQQMDVAAASGNVREYKNLQLEALFNWVNSGVKSNKFEARLEQLESLKGLDKESFETLWGVNLNDSSKKTVDSYIDAVKQKAISIKNNIDKIDNAFGSNPFSKVNNFKDWSSFEAYKGELAISLSQIGDYKRRMANIKEETYSKIPAGNFEDVLMLSDTKNIDKLGEKLKTKAAEYRQAEENATGELKEEFKQKADFLQEKADRLVTEFDNNEDLFLQSVNELYNFYGNGENVKGDFSIDFIDSLNVFNQLKDVYSLLDETSRVANYYLKLNGKNGFDEFRGEYYKTVDEYIDNLQITETGKVIVKPPTPVSQTTTTEEKEAAISETLSSVGVENIEQLKEEIKKGNVKVEKGGLRKRDENEPVSTEQEIAEAEAIADFWENTPNSEAFEEDVVLPKEGTIRDKAKNIKDAEEDTGKKSVKEEKGKGIDIDEIVDAVITVADKAWDKATVKFHNVFNKINSWRTKDGKEDYSGNLMKVLLNNPKDDVLKNITFKLEEAPKKNGKATKFPIFEKSADGKFYVKKFTDLKSNPYKYNVQVYYKNKMVGVLQEPERLVYEDAEGNIIPLGSINDPELYSELTLNSPDTFELFKKQYDDYKKAYDLITTKIGKKKSWTNQEVRAIFNPMIQYGRIASTKNQEFVTKVTDLKLFKGSGIIGIAPNGEITVLNSEELEPQEVVELMGFVNKQEILDMLKKSGRSYAVISKLPDGTFTNKLSVIFARETESKLSPDEAYEMLTADTISGLKVTVPSKDHGSTNFKFEKDADGNIIISMNNRKRSASQTFKVSSDELAAAQDIDDLVDLFNEKLGDNINNPLIKRLNIKLTKKDFTSSAINNDSKLSEIKENLNAAVSTPEIYTGFSINFYPNTGEEVNEEKPVTPEAPETPNMEPENTVDKIVNENLISIISQLEQKGFLTKNCD